VARPRLPGPARTGRLGRRHLADRAFWAACCAGFALIAVPALAVMASVAHQALPALGISLLTKGTSQGGLLNAIGGTLLLLAGVLVLAGSVGVGAGVYLAEFSTGRTQRVLRFCSEVLAGLPSIVIGYIAYVTLVVQFHWGYSLLAGVVALSVLVVPYIVRTTEVSFRQVPTYLREAAASLGLGRSTTVARILAPVALPGVVSGLLVALAISTGELAPLLFTAGATDQSPSLALFHRQVPYLTNVTFTQLSEPGSRAHALAAAAGAATLVLLLALIVLGRLVAARARRSVARMAL
jgi:phosphate transport system permease protein